MTYSDMMDVSVLYPVVSQDLSEAEYSGNCCNSGACLGNFTIQDLVMPESEATPLHDSSAWAVKPKHHNQRKLSNATQSEKVEDDRSDFEASVPNRKIMFDDVYVLTRLVRTP